MCYFCLLVIYGYIYRDVIRLLTNQHEARVGLSGLESGSWNPLKDHLLIHSHVWLSGAFAVTLATVLTCDISV